MDLFTSFEFPPHVSLCGRQNPKRDPRFPTFLEYMRSARSVSVMVFTFVILFMSYDVTYFKRDYPGVPDLITGAL